MLTQKGHYCLDYVTMNEVYVGTLADFIPSMTFVSETKHHVLNQSEQTNDIPAPEKVNQSTRVSLSINAS